MPMVPILTCSMMTGRRSQVQMRLAPPPEAASKKELRRTVPRPCRNSRWVQAGLTPLMQSSPTRKRPVLKSACPRSSPLHRGRLFLRDKLTLFQRRSKMKGSCCEKLKRHLMSGVDSSAASRAPTGASGGSVGAARIWSAPSTNRIKTVRPGPSGHGPCRGRQNLPAPGLPQTEIEAEDGVRQDSDLEGIAATVWDYYSGPVARFRRRAPWASRRSSAWAAHAAGQPPGLCPGPAHPSPTARTRPP